MAKKQPKYEYDKTYKVTIVLKNDERQVKYFKGSEMEEKERLIRDKISKISHWFTEEIIEPNRKY